MTVIWVAGLTLLIIFAALFAGILLDKMLHSKPVLTILFTVLSIPATIYATFRVVKSTSSRIQPVLKMENKVEESHRDQED